MKEATGELNLTVVVVIIVAMLSLFFFSFIWPKIQGNFADNTKCSEAICPKPGSTPHDGLVDCYYRDKNGTAHDITCSWKG